MQVKHSEIAVANDIEAASAMRPVFGILSVIVFLSVVALVACWSEKHQETQSITFTNCSPGWAGKSRYDLGIVCR